MFFIDRQSRAFLVYDIRRDCVLNSVDEDASPQDTSRLHEIALSLGPYNIFPAVFSPCCAALLTCLENLNHNTKGFKMYCSRYVMVLVFMGLALNGQSAPISRRSRAKKLPSEEVTTSTEKSEEVVNDESTTVAPNSRKNKALNLFGYYPSFLPAGLDYNDEDDDDVTFGISDEGIDEEDLSRTIPSKRKLANKKKNGNRYENDNLNSLQYDNSPMFFIRLPPTPYMFIPGLGYISQPPSLGPPMGPPIPQPQVNDPFINLPVDFVSNGKPIGVYEWNGAPNYPQVPQMQVDPYGYGSQPIMPPARPTYTPSYSKPKPKPGPTSSKVTNLKGQYVFNGKPSDSVYVLRDTYNSIYSDALQNFYP